MQCSNYAIILTTVTSKIFEILSINWKLNFEIKVQLMQKRNFFSNILAPQEKIFVEADGTLSLHIFFNLKKSFFLCHFTKFFIVISRHT
jgi:hypothetical protein